MFPSTTARVSNHTPEIINARIYQRMLGRLDHYERNPQEISHRLNQLDAEWDIERTLEANASTLILAFLVAGLVGGRRRTFLMAGGIAAFLLQHATQGWCPPVPLFRRFGYRTATEIETERYALMVLRGDFDDIQHDTDLARVMVTLQRPRETRERLR